ncbi:glycosyltransferase [Clostridium sp. Cult2]|uniref:glycosyltransferase n=1 Tax=Clostridium sp. Cult2 TaxID=2079003 RepID=UPI001F45FF2B|nr:glycosyltransferase family 2 protein [Clostridium sp. Cult2]MCF6465675.1 glycosyl transferase family 2 [Clostridium sp. Cult2]
MKKSIYYPVNKNIKLHIPPHIYDSIHGKDGVSVVCCTNKKNNLNNILDNFISQTYDKKELIVILNYDNPDIDNWEKYISSYENIQVHALDSKYSLGNCLNYGVSKSIYPIIAKFDDDDFYGPNYLKDMVKPFYFTNADVIGKATTYVYFLKKKILAIRNINKDNRYTSRVEGPTLVFKKEVFQKVNFQNKTLGEDIAFCNDCIRNGFTIFSTNKDNFVYIRNDENTHTWKINNNYFLKGCIKVCETHDFRNHI